MVLMVTVVVMSDGGGDLFDHKNTRKRKDADILQVMPASFKMVSLLYYECFKRYNSAGSLKL